jgi:hypothetical protein
MAGGAPQSASASRAAYDVAGRGIPACRGGRGLGSSSRCPGFFKIIAASHACALYFTLCALGARPQWLPFAALACGTAAFIALHQRTDLDYATWKVRLAPDQVADYRESEQRTEELMYLQSDRINAALAKVPTDANQPAMYFVGFAGYGPQKVFADEIALAARRVDERYGIAERRVLLVNDRRDFDRYPLASATALARTLAGISARMDRDRDVLCLALSSHGK